MYWIMIAHGGLPLLSLKFVLILKLKKIQIGIRGYKMEFKVIFCYDSVEQYFETERRAKLYAELFHGITKVIRTKTGKIIHNFCSKDIENGNN